MRKLLRLEDYMLLSVSFGADLFEDVAGAGGLAGFSYKQIYGFVPRKFRKSYFYTRTYELLKTEHIEKIIKNNKPFLRLTNLGRKKIIRDVPILAFQRKKWDRKWRIVIFDIQEKQRKKRDALRVKLKELGFGQWQKSVYISPHDFGRDMREFLKSCGLLGKVFVLESNVSLLAEAKIIAEKAWFLSKLNKSYQKIFDDWEEKGERGGNGFKKRLKARYLYLLAFDPCLPRELMPKDWAGERVRKLIEKL